MTNVELARRVGISAPPCLRRVRALEPGSFECVLDLARNAAMAGFDRARPRWEYTVVDGLEGGGAALVLKVHHSITDGVGGMKMLMMLFDLDRDPGPPGPCDQGYLGPLIVSSESPVELVNVATE